MSVAENMKTHGGRKLHDGMIKSKKTRTEDLIIAGICFLLMLVCLIPMLHVLASSLSSTGALVRNDVFIWPDGLNFDAYQKVLAEPKNVRALGWTAGLTAVCTLLSITLTICAAYPLIYPNLKGGKLISLFFLLTMYFSAGTIPNYLLLSSMGMIDTPYVLIFPNCISVFNVIIMRSFFYGVPESLREAAEIDGAGPIRTLVQVYLPLSLPVIATLALFYAVGRWNGFSDALMYLTPKGEAYYPIQLRLYYVLQNATNTAQQAAQESGPSQPGLAKTVQMATVMFATVPILLVYPWLQRYFVTGVTIGAVKG